MVYPSALAQGPSRAPLSSLGAVGATEAPELATEAGAEWSRLIFPWPMFQPASPDQFLEGWYTRPQLEDLVARGIEPVGVVVYTPGWAAVDPRYGNAAVPRNLYLSHQNSDNYWARFIFTLAKRYQGLVDKWIIWNEPDIYTDSERPTWAGSVLDFYQLQKVAYLATKEANPRATVVMAGLTYWWDKENNRPDYLARLLDVALADPTAAAHNYYFDAVNAHTYGNPLNSYAVPTLFKGIMAARGITKPVWISEANVVPYDDPAAPLPPGVFRATMDQQASYVIQAYALALAAGVERWSIYKLRDDPGGEEGQQFGLVRLDGSKKPAFTAYQVAAAYLEGVGSATYTWGGSSSPPSEQQITDLLDSGRSRYQFVWPGALNQVTLRRGQERITVVWNASPAPASALVPASASSATVVDKYGNATPLAPRGGAYVLALEPSTNNSDDRDPSLYLVGGSPLILLERQPQ